MYSFELLPHTADVRVRAVGDTRAGLLTAALRGMFAASGPSYLEPRTDVERTFDLDAGDFPGLLIDFLNEAVYGSDAHHEAYDGVRFTLVTDKKTKGAFLGHPVSGFATQIKAATHGGLDVKKNEEGRWEATVAFDV